MIFSERCKLAREVDEIFDEADKDLSGTKICRDSLGVITALETLGVLKESSEIKFLKEEE